MLQDKINKEQDTIILNLENIVKLQKPEEELIVHTISEPLSNIEQVGIWAGAILAVITIVYTFLQLRKLLRNDNELQSQINELVKLNSLFEQRLRMSVKPRLWTNGSGYNGTDYTIHITLNNRGQRAFYKGFVTLEGDGEFFLQKWKQDVVIENSKSMQLSGNTTKHPKESYFKIKILYYDDENYQYETIIEWDKSKVRFLETIEL